MDLAGDALLFGLSNENSRLAHVDERDRAVVGAGALWFSS